VLDVLGRGRDIRQPLARVVWGGCVGFGALVALGSVRPVPLILLAQIVNGLVLPLVAIVLLVAMNDRARLGAHVNTWKGNLAGTMVVVLCTVIGLRAIILAF
jgi:Mn2+/Fe2+ NRAMP family transporter